ncbi:AAA family ATPase [Paenibacillus xylanilyticus]|uniref:AAA family ATPase n=1 Tax=Paenibacillus xylanilyticus TaxID=248903 RepID=A0A7Y6ERI3_9BACL|nr:AAA family ATPase [Paenibacillus xylanilyticus]NUU73942.1 AAA family ATPase [Paenibacillus xylanilyticus]
MKLLFIYIESYGDMFKDISFNFSAEYNIKYDSQEQELSIDKNSNYPSRFYGRNISDITGIVGKNGAGKTSLLEIIGRNNKDRLELSNFKETLEDRYFMVFLENDHKFYFEGIGKIMINNIENYIDRLSGEGEIYRSFFFEKIEDSHLQIIPDYINRVIDRIVYIRDEIIQSSGDRLQLLVPEEINFIQRVKGGKYSWVVWYKLYLNLFRKGTIETPKIEITLRFDDRLKNISRRISVPTSDEHSTTFHGRLVVVDEWEEDFFNHFFELIINQFIAITKQVCYEGDDQDEEIEKIVGHIKGLKRDDFSIDRFRQLFEKIEQVNEKYDKSHLDGSIVRGLFKYIVNFFVSVYAAKEYILPGIYEFRLVVSADEHNQRIYEVLKNYDALQTYLQDKFDSLNLDEIDEPENNYKVKADESYTPFIIDNVNMSTGERNLLKLLSSIVYAVNVSFREIPILQGSPDEIKNYIFLIDEIESTMHLEWSRNLIFYIVNELDEITIRLGNKDYFLSDFGVQVQLIFSTHSPFLLSDLNRDSIIALTKDKTGKVKKITNIKSFAQNIQRIMSNEFFIKNSYGEFAQEKIKEIILCCEKKEPFKQEEKEHIRYTINEIGEPILRKKLQEKFILKLKEESVVSAEEVDLRNTLKKLYPTHSQDMITERILEILDLDF